MRDPDELRLHVRRPSAADLPFYVLLTRFASARHLQGSSFKFT